MPAERVGRGVRGGGAAAGAAALPRPARAQLGRRRHLARELRRARDRRHALLCRHRCVAQRARGCGVCVADRRSVAHSRRYRRPRARAAAAAAVAAASADAPAAAVRVCCGWCSYPRGPWRGVRPRGEHGGVAGGRGAAAARARHRQPPRLRAAGRQLRRRGRRRGRAHRAHRAQAARGRASAHDQSIWYASSCPAAARAPTR